MNIRIAASSDAPGLLDIYEYYTLNTSVTFEYQLPNQEEFAGRISDTLRNYPYLVAEEDGRLIGFSYASPFKTRAAYKWSAETSIYIRMDLHGKGIGTNLYRKLERYLAGQNICNLCACIAYPNPKSIAFHQAFGYRQTAHFHNSGYKSGKWHDIIWMEKTLCEHEIPPKPFIPFSELAEF